MPLAHGLFSAASAAVPSIRVASRIPSSLGPGELGRPPGREEEQRSTQVPPACAQRCLYAELWDRALRFGCLGKAFVVHVGTEPKHAV